MIDRYSMKLICSGILIGAGTLLLGSETILGIIMLGCGTVIPFFSKKTPFKRSSKKRGVAKFPSLNIEMLDSIISQIDGYVWSGDPKTHQIVYLSKGAEKLYGRELSDLKKDPDWWQKTVHPEDLEKTRNYTSKLHQYGRVRMEYRIIRPSGEVRWVNDWATIQRNKQGKATSLVGFVLDVTEKVTIRHELDERNKLFADFVKHTPASVAMFDIDMRYIMHSSQWLKDYGLEERDIIGQTHYEVFQNLPERWKTIHQRCLNGEKMSAEEDYFFREDGQVEYLRWEVHPWYKNSETIGGVMMFTQLLTRDYQREDELRDSRQRFDAMIQASPLFLVIVDTELKITSAQGRGLDDLGFIPDDLIGKRWDELPNLDTSLIEDWRRALEGEKFSSSLRIDNQIFDIWFSPSHNNEKDVISAFAVGVNSTKRSEIEGELRKSEERFRQIAEAAHEGIVFLREEEVVDSNEHFALLLGKDLSEVIGSSLTNLLPPSTQSAYRQLIAKKRKKSILTSFLVDSKGKKIPVEVRFQPIKGDKSRTYILTFRDISELLRNESILRNARDQAEAATLAKSHFLANMSHEIRTPMNAIIGITELISETPLTVDQREYVETISNSGQLMLALINDILDFSKIEAGKLELENKEFNLSILLEEVISILMGKAIQKKLELVLDISPTIPTKVIGDSARLRQVILNLATNSIKFTDNGYVTIRVTHLGGKEKSAEIRFEFEDSGIGIDQETQSRLFKPFTQADVSTTREFGGTGLGLAISKELVQRMGGSIHVESTPGSGSVFSFIIQFGVDPVSQDSQIIERRKELDGTSVLLMDNNTVSRHVVYELLEAWSCKVWEAPTPDEVMHALANQKLVDVVILDLKYLRDLESIESSPIPQAILKTSVPIILICNRQDYEGLSPKQKMAFQSICGKPILQSRLYSNLREVVKGETSAMDSRLLGMKKPKSSVRKKIYEEAISEDLKILLVEDNATNQMVAEKLLNRFGCHCTIANHGIEALDYFPTKQWDLILMDCQMPRLDGYGTTQQIRKLESDSKRHTFIVAMTAHALQGDMEKCLKAGMDGYLSKPITMESIGKYLAEATKHAGYTPTKKKLFIDLPTKEENFCIDIAYLKSFIPNPEDQKTILQTFLRECFKNLSELYLALQTGDRKQIRHIGHTIRGAAGNLKAKKFAALGTELENASGQGSSDEVLKLTLKIQEEFDLCRQEIETVFGPIDLDTP